MTSGERSHDLGPLPVVREEADDKLIKILQPAIKDALTGNTVPFTFDGEKWFMSTEATGEKLSCFLWLGVINGPLHVSMIVTRSADNRLYIEGEIQGRLTSIRTFPRSEYPSYYPKKFPDINKIGCSIAWAWVHR